MQIIEFFDYAFNITTMNQHQANDRQTIAVGYYALMNATTMSDNVAVGYNALIRHAPGATPNQIYYQYRLPLFGYY